MVANKKVSYLLGFMHYVIENIAPKVVAEVDRFDLSECYNQAPQSPLKCEYLFEFDSFSYFSFFFLYIYCGTSYWLYTTEENKVLKGRLNDLSKEKAHVAKNYEELWAEPV